MRGAPPPPPSGGRGGPPQRGGAPSGVSGPGQVALADHVQTIGVRKPGYGREGRRFEVYTNHFKAQITDNIIAHYDGASHSFRFQPIPLSPFLPLSMVGGGT
jgi:eukaryotic translation initiation factor 2C